MKQITKGQKLQVLGLLTLAKSHNLALQVIEKEICGIVGEKDKFGHVGDSVWGELMEKQPEHELKRLIDVYELKVK